MSRNHILNSDTRLSEGKLPLGLFGYACGIFIGQETKAPS